MDELLENYAFWVEPEAKVNFGIVKIVAIKRV